MDLGDLGRVLRHRKILVSVLLMVTAVASVAGFTRSKVQYKTQASLVVLAPSKPVVPGSKSTDEARSINPFLSFGGSQETAAQVLLVRMSDDAIGLKLEEAGVRGEWKFEIKGGSGPLIQVTATEASPDQARSSAGHILDAAGEQLTALQREAGSPDDQMIRMSVVNTPNTPEAVYDGKIRSTALVVALGLLLTIGVPMAVEGVARGRADRADAARDDEQDELEGQDEKDEQTAGSGSTDASPPPALVDNQLPVLAEGADAANAHLGPDLVTALADLTDVTDITGLIELDALDGRFADLADDAAAGTTDSADHFRHPDLIGRRWAAAAVGRRPS